MSILKSRATGAMLTRLARGHATTRASVAPRHCFSIIIASMASPSRLRESSTLTGPNMHPKDGRVVSNFITQALQGDDITIFGDGTQTRSFCYVDDLVSGFLALMASNRSVTGPVNLGNPGEFTMLGLAERVIDTTNSKSKIAFLPLPQDGPRQRKPDITVASDVLGWKPTVPLAQGLERTVAYFEELLRRTV